MVKIYRRDKYLHNVIFLFSLMALLCCLAFSFSSCASSQRTIDGQNSEIDLPEKDKLEKIALSIDMNRMLKDIAFLSSEEMRGRPAGSPANQEISNYIEEVFRSLGLQPFNDLGLEDLRQEFLIPSSRCYLESPPEREEAIRINNIIGVIPGSSRKDMYIIFAANFDGIGIDMQTGKHYPGADYNASGVSAVVELARAFSKMGETPPATLVFAALNGDECGNFGSQALANVIEKSNLKDKVSIIYLEGLGGGSGDYMDIWDNNYKKNQLMVEAVDDAARFMRVTLEINGINEGSSGNLFFVYHIPCVICDWSWCERSDHPDYHKTSDTVDKLSREGLLKSTQVVGIGGYLIALRSS